MYLIGNTIRLAAFVLAPIFLALLVLALPFLVLFCLALLFVAPFRMFLKHFGASFVLFGLSIN